MMAVLAGVAAGCACDKAMNARYYALPTRGDATAAIQSEIDRAFKSGGGTVVVGRGEWSLKALRLRSRVTLYLESGAKLIGSRNVEDYFILERDTVEPVDPAVISHDRWMLSDSCGRDTLTRYPGNRWNNGLIRLYKATDAAIVGEPGSVIFGNNPYDEKGEEGYRGPLGISAIDCTKSAQCLWSGRSLRPGLQCADRSHVQRLLNLVPQRGARVHSRGERSLDFP